MIFDVIKDAMVYSMGDKETILKVGLLFMISTLLVPVLLILIHKNVSFNLELTFMILGILVSIFIFFIIGGYSYRIIDASLHGIINVKESLPKLDNFKELMLNGIKIVIVRFLWLLPGFILLLFGLLFETTYIEYILIPVFALWFICYFISIISVVHMVNTGSIVKAFDFNTIIDIMDSIGLKIYFEFYIFILSLMIGFFILFSFAITLVSLLVSLVIGQLFSSISFSTLSSWMTICLIVILMLFIIAPLYIIFESRAIGSIYNLRDG